MRLEPIEKPKGLLMRIAFWMTRRQLGKVLTSMKVLYPRMLGVLAHASLPRYPMPFRMTILFASCHQK